MKPSDGLPGFVALCLVALASAGCGEGMQVYNCNPPCPAGTRCMESGCVPDNAAARVDIAVPADLGRGSGCGSSCSGATPHCGPDGLCVPCVDDGHCPAGTYCRKLGLTAACVAGCSDDGRCGGGAMKCCDGQCVDTGKDARNCGACGTACMTPNAGAACVAGACTAGACRAGWGDCNANPADGCETNLRADGNHCGACGAICAIKNGIAACGNGCYLAACHYGYDDCNDSEMDGCEVATQTDPKNCGGCGVVCVGVPRAQVGCSNGGCALLACNAGYADCDGLYNDGCEVNIGNDVRNCGRCGNLCAQGQVCTNGECTCPLCSFPNSKAGCFGNMCGIASCNPGWANCDGVTLNGCEQNIDSNTNHCGACGAKCPQGLVCVQQSCTCPQCKIPNAKSVCINNVCVLDACLPGYANCDGDPVNGCEVDLNSDANNCSACGKACGADMACSLGACTMCGAQLIDNGGILCVPKGMSYALAGDKCYSSQVIIHGAVTITAHDGNSGGALILRSPSILVSATGSIVGDAAGGLGGQPAPTNGGYKGGGPAPGCGGGPGNSVGQGGSGGGYGGTGGHAKQYSQDGQCDRCDNPTTPKHCWGLGGGPTGTANNADIDMGSGGGAGGNTQGCMNSGGRGGAGGASVLLLAKAVQIDGTITVAGEHPPTDKSCGYHPGGGGGSGGGVVIRAEQLTGAGSLLAAGGQGGDTDGQNGDWGWSGGGGSGGRIKIFATSDKFVGSLVVTPGAGGAACKGGSCSVGEAGGAGTTNRSQSIPNLWATIMCGGL